MNIAIAFCLIVCLVAAVAWSVVYSYGILGCFKLALLMILRDFLLVGMVVATAFWLAPHMVCALRRAEDI